MKQEAMLGRLMGQGTEGSSQPAVRKKLGLKSDNPPYNYISLEIDPSLVEPWDEISAQ